MAKRKYYRIGKREDTINGAVFTPESTDNGFCYKDEKSIAEKEGICYIAECAFKEYEHEEGKLCLYIDTIDEYIRNGSVSTYASALEEVSEVVRSMDGENVRVGWFETKEKFELYNEFCERLTKSIFEIIDWQCFGTYLNEIDIDEQLFYFCVEKLIERINAERTTCLSNEEVQELENDERVINIDKWGEIIEDYK